MKYKSLKLLSMAMVPIIGTTLPIMLVACSSTSEDQKTPDTPDTQNTYQPSESIANKFTLAEFKVFSKGWELLPLEGNHSEKIPAQLIGNKLSLSWYTDVPVSKTNQNATKRVISKYVLNLTKNATSENWSDGVIVNTKPLQTNLLIDFL